MPAALVEIEGAQHATVLGAQAFTSLIAFLVVASVFAPGDADLSERTAPCTGEPPHKWQENEAQCSA